MFETKEWIMDFYVTVIFLDGLWCSIFSRRWKVDLKQQVFGGQNDTDNIVDRAGEGLKEKEVKGLSIY